MKKFVLLAAIVCGSSLAGHAANLKASLPVVLKKSVENTKVTKPARIAQLFMMEFTCEGQGWSIPVVGNTKQEMLDAYFFYDSHLDC